MSDTHTITAGTRKLRRRMPPRLHGFATVGIRSQVEVARMLGITRSAVSIAEAKAIKKLRRAWVEMFGNPDDTQQEGLT